MLNPVMTRASLDAKVMLMARAAPTAAEIMVAEGVATTESCAPETTAGALNPGACVVLLVLPGAAATAVAPMLLLYEVESQPDRHASAKPARQAF
jgi:hypothetical protein